MDDYFILAYKLRTRYGGQISIVIPHGAFTKLVFQFSRSYNPTAVDI